jgi:NAD(P)-dependent dehydrogenase (short-subunit alcohol dehydrogenase family)
MVDGFGGFGDRVAIVTGGSRSIGRAVSVALAAAGARVVVNYRHDVAAAEDTVSQITAANGTAVAVQADISTPREARRLTEQARTTFGPIDYLVNNAAVLRRTPLLEIEPAEWNDVVAINLTGTFLVSQAVARDMVSRGTRGSIVIVSSINERYARLGLAHYSASKGGVSTLTRQLALELAPYGIRANAVALGLFETDMNRHRLSEEETRRHYLDRIPLGLIGKPEDAVGPILFLLSDAARLVTGATLAVDGGRSVA